MAEEEIDPIVNLPTPEVVDTYFAVTDENGILLNKVRPENIEGQIPTDKLNIDLSTLNSYETLQGKPCFNGQELESGDNSLTKLGIQGDLSKSSLRNFIDKTAAVNANAFVITNDDGNLISASAGSATSTAINRISTLANIDSDKAAVLGVYKDGFVLTDIKVNSAGETVMSPEVATSINNLQTQITAVDTRISNLGTVLNFKGTKGTDKDLPNSGNTAGDVWNVTDTDMNYVYTGEQWDPLGSAYYDSDKRLYSKEGVNLDNEIFIVPADETYSTVEYIGEGDSRKKITTNYNLLKVRFKKTIETTSAIISQSEPEPIEEGSI